MGDFNSIVDIDLDKKGGNKNSINQNTTTRWLIDNNFTDTFRFCNPSKKDYTWHNGRSQDDAVATRIDQIWTQDDLDYYVIDACIKDSDLITGSDHRIMITTINSANLINNHKPAKLKNSGSKRRSFKYDEMTKEKWNEYKETIKQIINKDIP